MKCLLRFCLAIAAIGPSHAPRLLGQETPARFAVYSGMCDASAAVALGPTTFIVGDNEITRLHVFRHSRPGPAAWVFPWDEHLGIDPQTDKHPQADIEGATRVGNRIYWITSHGRNKDGKWRKNRHRFFATTIRSTQTDWIIEPYGKPYQDLMIDLVHEQHASLPGLAQALGLGIDEAKRLAPKASGLNIEGLTATPDGREVLIGFRNPLIEGKALLVPLRNPAAVLAEAARPQFGKPILLDLAVTDKDKKIGLAVRSIEYSKRHNAYLIAAGPPQPKKICALYRWSGVPEETPKLLPKATRALESLVDFTPEALVIYPDTDKVQLLSDDGTRKVKVGSPAECQKGAFENGQCEAKTLLDDRRKTFRDVWVAVE